MIRSTTIALLWLCMFLTAPGLSAAQTQFERLDAIEREVEAADAAFDIDRFELKFAELRHEYQRLNKPQEEIWLLYKYGFDREARSLEDHLRLRLRIEDFFDERSMNVGQTGIRQARLSTGEKVILRQKIEEGIGPDPRLEGLAYELSRALGFHIVPITVIRPYKGSQISLQFFIEDSQPGGESFIHNPYQNEQMHILDYLINHADRHGDNWLIGPGGKVITIDNDLIFSHDGYSSARKTLRPNISSDLPPQAISQENHKALQKLKIALETQQARLQMTSSESAFIKNKMEVLLKLPIKTCMNFLWLPNAPTPQNLDVKN